MKHVFHENKICASGVRRLLALLIAAALLTPVLPASASADYLRTTVPAATPAPEDDVGSYTDEELIALAQEAAKNSRSYSTVSNKKVSLELPYRSEHLKNSLRMEVKFTKNGAIYIMPKPEANNGVLDTIKAGTLVTVIAEYNGYYFFVADDGRMGWNGKAYFKEPDPESGKPARPSASAASSGSEEDVDYLLYTDEELLEIAEEAAANSRNYSTVSTTKAALEFPYPEEYLDEAISTEIKFTKGGAIYIMPKPKAGNGALGTIKAGTHVTVIAEYKGFYFFIADDGRMGWNGKDYFTA